MKLKCKRLQKNEYIFFEVKGRRTYLVHDKKLYRKAGITPFRFKSLVKEKRVCENCY